MTVQKDGDRDRSSRSVGGGDRVYLGDHALVEGASGAIRVVAADAEDDRALLFHRRVCERR